MFESPTKIRFEAQRNTFNLRVDSINNFSESIILSEEIKRNSKLTFLDEQKPKKKFSVGDIGQFTVGTSRLHKNSNSDASRLFGRQNIVVGMIN